MKVTEETIKKRGVVGLNPKGLSKLEFVTIQHIVQKSMIVVAIEESNGILIYRGFSNSFVPLGDTEELPTYSPMFKKNGIKLIVSFKRI